MSEISRNYSRVLTWAFVISLRVTFGAGAMCVAKSKCCGIMNNQARVNGSNYFCIVCVAVVLVLRNHNFLLQLFFLTDRFLSCLRNVNNSLLHLKSWCEKMGSLNKLLVFFLLCLRWCKVTYDTSGTIYLNPKQNDFDLGSWEDFHIKYRAWESLTKSLTLC